ncbi:MAG: HAD family hydrolase [Christensenellales bacterium]|jgi:HAD superfamily hydrolase (TIGR01509 family)
MKISNAIRHVILDAGGVICYARMGSWRTTVRFEEIIAPARLATADPARIAAAMEASAQAYIDESLPIADENMEFALRRNYFLDLAKRLDWVLTDREADALARDMTENDARYDFYPDTRAGLARLGARGGLHLLSNAMPSLKRVLANAGLIELFDEVMISTDEGLAKPDPAIYRAMLARIGEKPDACAFVDDRVENLEAARALGIRAVHMARGEKSDWDGEVARDLFEVARLLGR